MIEKWKDITNFEGFYQISNKGRIKSLSRIVFRPVGSNKKMVVRERILKLGPNSQGYIHAYLCTEGVKYTLKVHRLVAKLFLLNPNKCREVNHLDGNKSNNCITNLEWCTPSHNSKHAFDIGLSSNVGSRHPKAQLNDCQVLEIKKLIKSCELKLIDIAKIYNVNPSVISKIKSGATWSHIKE